MLMGDKEIMDLGILYVHFVKNLQNTVAAAGVHHEKAIFIANGKAGIVIMNNSGISRAKYV